MYSPIQIDIDHLIETLNAKGITYLYLHFDFDCLEPNDYDKTYYNVPNGVSISDAEACIEALTQNFSVVGSSVLESVTTKSEELQPISKIIDLLI
ncbi:MAG: hypothetical protein AAF705_04475 [Bacteroidota bacterium]